MKNAAIIKNELRQQIASIKERALNSNRTGNYCDPRPAFWRYSFIVAPCQNDVQMGDHWEAGNLNELTNARVNALMVRAKEHGAEELSFSVIVQHRANFDDEWSEPAFAETTLPVA